MKKLTKYLTFAMIFVVAGCDSLNSNANSLSQSSASISPIDTSEPSNTTSTQMPSNISTSIEASDKTSLVSASNSEVSSSSEDIPPKPIKDNWIYDNKDNYYDVDAIDKLTGADLKTKLFETISNHVTISYKTGLTEAYNTTDLRPDGTVWDMYGDFNFSLSGNACGNYKNEGDCWNKEHSMPKSWFNDQSPMYSDIYHLFPTDGKINGMRSNYPYGEVGQASYIYETKNANRTGLTLINKLGTSSYPGYSGRVFEPDDMYKGDFARAYFYMVTAYENRVASWKTGDTNLGGTSYPGLNSWSTEMLVKWSLEDPISQKEINRTNAAYLIQKNRNPYIDNTNLVCKVFGPYNDVTKSLCRSALEEVKVTGIKLEEENVELKTNETYQFHASVLPNNASNKKIYWSISDSNIGTIDENGLFVAKQEGQATITAKTEDGNYSALCNIKVEYIPPVKVTGVYLKEEGIALTQNDTAKIVVNFIPENATNKHCTFESDNEDVASVDTDGNVKAKNQGEANIKVTTADGGFVATCRITVSRSNKETTTIDKTIITSNVVDGYEYVVGGTIKEVSEAIYIGKGGFLYNTTSLGDIKKIVISYAKGGSSGAVQDYNFSTNVISTKPDESFLRLETSTGGQTAEIIPPNSGNGYFRIDISSKNLQFINIVIYL